MAGTQVVVQFTGAFSATNHPLLELMAASNAPLLIRRISLTCAGVDDTQARAVITSTNGGTATDGTAAAIGAGGVFVTKGDIGASLTPRMVATGAAAASTTTGTARAGFSVDPTSTGEVRGSYGGYAVPTSGLPPFPCYIKVKEGTAFRIWGSQANTLGYSLIVELEE